MERYYVYGFDRDTFVVADIVSKREICVCGNYENGGMDADIRAYRIAEALNEQAVKFGRVSAQWLKRQRRAK